MTSITKEEPTNNKTTTEKIPTKQALKANHDRKTQHINEPNSREWEEHVAMTRLARVKQKKRQITTSTLNNSRHTPNFDTKSPPRLKQHR